MADENKDEIRVKAVNLLSKSVATGGYFSVVCMFVTPTTHLLNWAIVRYTRIYTYTYIFHFTGVRQMRVVTLFCNTTLHYHLHCYNVIIHRHRPVENLSY